MPIGSRRPSPRLISLAALLVALLVAPLVAITGGTSRLASAQENATPSALSCEPQPAPATSNAASPVAQEPVAAAEGELIEVTFGYVPVSIFAPVFVAKEKGYFAEQGLDVTLEPLPGGSDLVILTASGEFDISIGGAGPAFWNALSQGLGITAVAPGHAEGNPVATPLMISRDSCESGAITSVADLEGKKVAVNARGATEYWLDQALRTAGLTIDDVDLQTLAFPDAVAALQSGAIAASMVGEPLATKAEQDGIAVRLLTDFPVQNIQPTLIFANNDFIADNPDAATGLITAYLKASRDLSGGGFKDPANLAIVEQYTQVPAALVAAAVEPVFPVDGQFNIDGLNALQQFFRDRELLEYDDNLDPAAFIDTQYVDAALQALGPYQP